MQVWSTFLSWPWMLLGRVRNFLQSMLKLSFKRCELFFAFQFHITVGRVGGECASRFVYKPEPEWTGRGRRGVVAAFCSATLYSAVMVQASSYFKVMDIYVHKPLFL